MNEQTNPISGRRLSHVVFDFDGTLSWLRHGWPDLMLEIFRRNLPRREGETDAAVDDLLRGIVLGMNGDPTLLQVIRFAALARERGGHPPEPEAMRREYQERLDAEIAARTALIAAGRAKPEDFVVFGARPLLEWLQRAGRTLVILSGTQVERVQEEAKILQLAPFFGAHVYGSSGDPLKFSKRDVLRRLLAEEGIAGENLLSFGAGPVEIAATKELGGVAFAVCSDERENGSGRMDEYKRRQLLAAGADAALPDFRDAVALLEGIFNR